MAIDSRPVHARRRGLVVVLFALLLLGFVSLLALVVDLGLVLLTRRQLQAMANGAAAAAALKLPNPANARQAAVDMIARFENGTSSGRWNLQLNSDNRIDGDVVFGIYQLASTSHREASRSSPTPYVRDDFTPEVANPDSVLVRLRRTGEAFEDGVSSFGPRIAGLFSRALALAPSSTSESAATDFAVRATSIATSYEKAGVRKYVLRRSTDLPNP